MLILMLMLMLKSIIFKDIKSSIKYYVLHQFIIDTKSTIILLTLLNWITWTNKRKIDVTVKTLLSLNKTEKRDSIVREWNYNTKLKLNIQYRDRDHSCMYTYNILWLNIGKKKENNTLQIPQTLGWVVPSSQVVKNSKIILFYLNKKDDKIQQKIITPKHKFA